MSSSTGWRLAVHDSLPSTSDLCRSLAEAGEPEGLAILARQQTAGHGTRGRNWAGPAGNLALSALLRPGGPAREASQWSLLAGVALAEALSADLPGDDALALKWPNDVLLHGRKVAGILSESAADGQGGLSWLSLGFGANLAVAPDLPDRPTACLAEIGPPPSPEAVAWRVLSALARWRGVHAQAGFAPARAAFLARAPAQGTRITLRLGERMLGGAFAGLGEDGSLLLRTGGLVQAFAAGEVTIGNGV
jgi:BirA family biotin operon repressor/biotin-[acetyl-CoA-carboxylase] ligase